MTPRALAEEPSPIPSEPREERVAEAPLENEPDRPAPFDESATRPETAPQAAERPASRWARAELAAVQTLLGTAMGAELCAMAECDEARAWAASALFGAGGGLTLSLLTTRDGIPQGRAQAVNSGAFFGTWLGAATIGITARDTNNVQAAMGVLLAGQAAGIGLGLTADHVFELTPGEVSLANSAALWTGVSSLLALAAIDPISEDDDKMGRRFLGVTLATTSLALVGGAALARTDHVSRGRALMVDLGAVAGGGLSPLLVWLAAGDSATSEALLWSSVAGTLGGAATTYLLTRGWDAPETPPVSLSVAPTEGGAIATVKLTR